MTLPHVLKRTLYVLLFFLPSYSVCAQEYLANIQYFGIEDGLSHRDVYDIHQDEEGFLWIGTKYGLNRFDGYEFKWYTKEKNGLGSNTVHHILADGRGNLWLFESYNWYYFDDIQSVSILNIHTENIQTFEEKFQSKSPIDIEDIKFGLAGDQGELYFGIDSGGLVSYHPDTGWNTLIERGQMLFQPQLFTSNKTIWGVGDAFKLVETDTSGKILSTIDISGYADPNQEIRFFITNQDNEGHLWVRIILSPEPITLKIETKSLSPKIQYYQGVEFKTRDHFSNLFYHSSNDVFWYAGNPNLIAWKPDIGVLFDFTDHYPELAAGDIHNIYFDQSNRAWISSFYGLFQVQLYKSPFKRYLYHDTPNQPSSNFYSCRGIWAEDSSIWVNTYKGLKIISKNDEKIQHIPEVRSPNKYNDNFRFLVLPHGMLRDAKGNYWMGDQGLVYKGNHDDTFQVFPYFNNEIGGSVWSICEDRFGNIWVGTARGLGVLDTNKNVCMPVEIEPPFHQLNNSKINYISQGNTEELYLGTSTGFYIFHPQKGIIARYGIEAKGDYYIPSDDIRHFWIDTNGDMWLATYGGGLVKLKLKKDRTQETASDTSHYQQFTIADGLSNNNLYAVYPDDYNNLWLSSDYGIIVFNLDSYQSQAYLPENGTTHHEFNTISHFKDRKGQIYFGSLNGVTAFHPADVLQIEKPFDAPLVVRGLQQFDRDKGQIVDKFQLFKETQKIVLKPGERFFELQFSLLTYEHTDKIRYAYKIDHIQKNWTYTSEPAIRFGGLPYGNHTLHIRAQGPDGRFSSQELMVSIHIAPPIYLKWWFSVLAVLMVSVFAFSFFRQRTQALKKRQKMLKRAVEEGTKIIRKQNERLTQDKATIEKQAEELKHLDKVKSRFFANISHELRTPLTLLLGPINSLVKKQDTPPKIKNRLKLAQRNGEELLKLVNEILDLSKLEADKLELEERVVELYPFTRKIIASFEAIASMRQLKFIFQFKAEPELCVELDAGKFQKILNNLLSNAFKYTEDGGSISLIIEDHTNYIYLCIADSGRGISKKDLPYIFDRFYQSTHENIPAEGGTGIGLALSKELIVLMKGKIWAESEVGIGSKFFVELPKKEVLGAQNKVLIHHSQKHLDSTDTASSPIKHKSQDSHKELILLVEDHVDIQEYIKTILGDTYELMVARNGKDALEMLTNTKSWILNESRQPDTKHQTLPIDSQPSLIISDVMMPIMDGFQFVEALKEHNSFSQIPIIMLTAKAGVEDKMQALRMGVDDYILKPFEEEELLVRIKNLLLNATTRKVSRQQEKKLEGLESDALSPLEKKWLKDQELLLKEHMKDSNFSISQWSELTNMSERNLQRKLKQFVGLSPHQYITEIRLQEGRKILENKTYHSLSEVAYAVGFSNLRAFSRNFKKRFGKTPSDYS